MSPPQHFARTSFAHRCYRGRKTIRPSHSSNSEAVQIRQRLSATCLVDLAWGARAYLALCGTGKADATGGLAGSRAVYRKGGASGGNGAGPALAAIAWIRISPGWHSAFCTKAARSTLPAQLHGLGVEYLDRAGLHFARRRRIANQATPGVEPSDIGALLEHDAADTQRLAVRTAALDQWHALWHRRSGTGPDWLRNRLRQADSGKRAGCEQPDQHRPCARASGQGLARQDFHVRLRQGKCSDNNAAPVRRICQARCFLQHCAWGGCRVAAAAQILSLEQGRAQSVSFGKHL